MHMCLGHLNPNVMKHILTSCTDLLSSNKNSILTFCDACQLGKNLVLHFDYSTTKTSSLLKLIHTDLWGPSPFLSNKGYKYYIIFVDDYTRYNWVVPLKAKSDSLNAFKLFKTNIENQPDKRIKSVQLVWGGECRCFSPFLAEHGIHFRHPCLHTHHQNGIAERKYRHITEAALTLLAQAKMPFTF